MESNINVSNKFDAAVNGRMKRTHRITQVGTSVSKNSLSMNHEMVQKRWGIHPSMANNMVELTTQHLIRNFFPHPSLMKHMCTHDRILRYKRLPCNVFLTI